MSLSIITNYDYPALIALFGICKTIQYTYPKVDSYLQRFEKYNMLPLERRKYIIKNFIKSFFLLSLSVGLFRPLIWPAIKYGHWNNRLIHFAGALYTSNDIMGLVMVKNLPCEFSIWIPLPELPQSIETFSIRNGLPSVPSPIEHQS